MSKNSVKAEQLEFPDGRSILTKDGSEIPDPRPVEIPVGFEKPESLQEMIRRFVRDRSIQDELDAKGVESFDEADDFEVDEDLPVNSPYEEQFDPQHIVAREQEIRSGLVRPPTQAEIDMARDILAKAKAAAVTPKQEPPAAAPAPVS